MPSAPDSESSVLDHPAIDWSSLPEEVPCPACGYNLRTLTIPRCPECGRAFEWDTVLEAARRRVGSRLFEHQWRTRPLRSFIHTTWSLMWPWRFWRREDLRGPPSCGALLVQVGLTVVMLMTLVIAFISLHWMSFISRTPYRGGKQFGYVEYLCSPYNISVLRYAFSNQLSHAMRVLPDIALCGLLLACFVPTRRRCGLNRREVVRVVAYAAITGCLYAAGAFLLARSAFSLGMLNRTLMERVGMEGIAGWMLAATTLAAAAMGLRFHFRVRHSEMLLLAILVVVYLAMLGIVVKAAVAYDNWSNPISDAIWHYTGILPLCP